VSTEKIVISGTGCALADFLYNDVSFEGVGFKKYRSEQSGDGGLSPGKLVFTEELERFFDQPYREILTGIIGNRQPEAFNVGGPSLVSLIHAAQMLEEDYFEVKFFGLAGKDETAHKIFEIVQTTPLCIENYLTTSSKATPFTDVFSDSTYEGGHGERTFVNNIGAAWEYSPEHLNDSFFESQIVCFGGTALVPQIHDDLTNLLTRAKNNHCITLVNTVFDFRNERNNPGNPWPLVNSLEDYDKIDVLIMDCEEALKISGQQSIEKAADFFASTMVSSFIITNGANDIYAKSMGGIFGETTMIRLPVSEKVKLDLKSTPESRGDTTGCGDNFTGGIIASLAHQLQTRSKGQFDLCEAISWGVASGGFICYIVGGTYLEKQPGDKRKRVAELQKEYLQQIEN